MLALQQTRSPYKEVLLTQTESGWVVREDKDLLAVFRDRQDAEVYIDRRTQLPWRIRS